jgi:hypothetical protein
VTSASRNGAATAPGTAATTARTAAAGGSPSFPPMPWSWSWSAAIAGRQRARSSARVVSRTDDTRIGIASATVMAATAGPVRSRLRAA